MAPKKREKHSSSMPHSRTVVDDGGHDRVRSTSPAARASQKDCSKASSAAAVVGTGIGPGEVDDVVGEPGERVDGVDVAPGLGGEQAGAPAVRRAVLRG